MAEDLLDDLTGGEEPDGEAAERAGIRPPPGPGAFAAAAALQAAALNPELASKTSVFLDKQARLTELQMAHFEEEQRLRLSNMAHQSLEGRLRRLSQMLRIGLQVLAALIVTGVGLGLAVMVADAFNSRTVVVEPFDTPPGLAGRGLSGKVVAAGLLDDLTKLQDATRASAAKRNLKTAWTGEIKVEVPETGVSIGEIDDMLKQRFGHDLHIDGDLVQTDTGGLALTVRGGGVLPKTFTGGAGDLDTLTGQAAEYVYGQSEPYLYSSYLENVGRDADAIAFIQAIYAKAPQDDRAYLLNSWANGMGDVGKPAEAIPLYQQALRLKPDFWIAYNNLINGLWGFGREEEAWRLGEEMKRRAGGRPGKGPEILYQNTDNMTGNLLQWRKAIIADMAAHGGVGSGTSQQGPILADNTARLHDPKGAEIYLRTSQGQGADPNTIAMTHFVHGYIALDQGDYPQAAAEMEAFQADFANPVISTNYPSYNCWIAPAEEMGGHPDKADAVLKAAGSYVDCYRFKGDILDHRGDWAGAQKAYAAAVALAPDLPGGAYSWGRALARHSDLAGAEAKYAEANRHGPNWADPLKAWGDALAAQGRWKEALAKYEAAAKDAPDWTELKAALAVAQRRAGA